MRYLFKIFVISFLFYFPIRFYSQNDNNNSINEIVFCLEDFNCQRDVFRFSLDGQNLACFIDTLANDSFPNEYEELHAKRIEHVNIDLTNKDQQFLRDAILDFFVNRKDSIYEERFIVDDTYVFDSTPTYISILIRTGKSSLKYDFNVAKGYNISLQRIENIRFRYTSRFCKFLQYIQYVVANRLGGVRWIKYKDDLDYYKKHTDYYVYDQFLSSK